MKITAGVLLGGIILGMLGCTAEHAERVSVRDVLVDPTKYLGIRLQIRGETRDSIIDEPPNRGTYELLDDSDRTIKVRTRNLPAPGEIVVVDGQVLLESGTAVPQLRELSRCRAEGFFNLCDFSWWGVAVIVSAVLVAGLVAVLMIVLLKPEAAASMGGAVTQVFRRGAAETRRLAPNRPGGASVEVVSGPRDMEGLRFALRERTSFGREQSDVTLDDPFVSREQAYILYDGAAYRLFNQSQTNPTLVNGNVVNGPRDLSDGDEVVMGAVKLRFVLGR